MLELVIDGRKSYDAGIGTYLRQLIPRVLQRLPRVKCMILVAPGAEAWLAELQALAGARLTGQVLITRPLSIGEQHVLRKIAVPGRLFWATSLAHPLFSRSPMVATVHDVAQLALDAAMVGGTGTRLAAHLYFQSLRNCARELLFVSAFSHAEFTRLVGTAGQGVTVTPLAADSEWFRARGAEARPEARPYFISVSSLRPHKNFEFLVRGFADIADRLPHQLMIVGESRGLRTADTSVAAEIAKVGGRVRFLGRLPDADLRRWVAHADAMVFPSLYEGFGLPPLEALSAGCPALCSTAGALREVCGDAASYFDPRDATSLQQCLLRHAATAPGRRAERVEAGLARARTFDWERTAELTAAVLERALHRN